MVHSLFVHIGHPKTGTGSLQQTLRANAAALGKNGLFYYTGARNHHPIGHAAHRGHQGGARARRLSADFFKTLERTDARVALISTETLIRLDSREAEAFVASLCRYAREVTVVMYVRHPVSFASSAAQESVRLGRPLANALERPRVLPLRTIAERWERASGGRIIVRPFARGSLVRGDVVDDMLATVGLSSVAGPLTRVTLNDPLSATGVALLDRANRFGKMPRDATRIFEGIAGPRYVLPAATLDKVRQRSCADLAFLAERYGVVLPEPDDAPNHDPGMDDKTLDSLAAVLRDSALYAHKVDRSFLGRVLGQRSPFTRRDDIPPHWLAPLARRLGLTRRYRVRLKRDSLATARIIESESEI